MLQVVYTTFIMKKLTDQTARFSATRRHHLNEAAEDYTELISDLIKENGEARVGQLASLLGVTHVTALRTIRRLAREGYVTVSFHKPIQLTAKGKKTAALSKERHGILLKFFIALGVPRNIAEIDVEGVEHHISAITLRAIKRALTKL